MKSPLRYFLAVVTISVYVSASSLGKSAEVANVSTSSDSIMQLVDLILNLSGEDKGKFSSTLASSLMKKIPDMKKLKLGGEKGFEDMVNMLLKGVKDNIFDFESLGLKYDHENAMALVTKYLSKKFSSEDVENEIDSNIENEHEETLHTELLDMAKIFFKDKFKNFDVVNLTSSIEDQIQPNWMDMNLTSTNIWMMVKSLWQRILAYMEEENSLTVFLQSTPVKIIDHVLSLGDDVNLANFLAKKLKPELAVYLTSKINPYLGPFQDFNSFYNFTKEYEINGFLDYFTSDRFVFTISAMSRVASAYMDDTISEDVVDQFVDFISFNNTELRTFYKSFINSQHKNKDSERIKRDVLQDIANSYKPYSNNPYNNYNNNNTPLNGRQYASRFGLPGNMNPALNYDPARDGGYGGGGYGYGSVNMNSLDPYVVLGSLALGTILGFLLFRALRGTRNGRRDIGDGSLSLWLSDMPNEYAVEGPSFGRMKRQSEGIDKDGEEFNLPVSMRGGVWSSDPLVGDDFVEELWEEDDIADHLNKLWDVYHNTNETSCIHSHLCGVMANRTAEHLTGKDSGMVLLMASVSNMMGLEGSGRLLDQVTNNLVGGGSYVCPAASGCNLLF